MEARWSHKTIKRCEQMAVTLKYISICALHIICLQSLVVGDGSREKGPVRAFGASFGAARPGEGPKFPPPMPEERPLTALAGAVAVAGAVVGAATGVVTRLCWCHCWSTSCQCNKPLHIREIENIQRMRRNEKLLQIKKTIEILTGSPAKLTRNGIET